MSPPPTLVDGVPATTLAVNDRAVQYGDGLFETMRCEGARVRWLDRHLARLQRGCERLGIAMPDPVLLQREFVMLLGGEDRCLLKLIVTRGAAAGRGYRPTGSERPMRILTRYDWPPPPAAEFRAHRSPIALGSNPALAGIKHLNRLEQVLGQRAAAIAGVDEALQATESGEIIAGTMSNAFLVQGDVWLTPPIERCGVAGIMRSLVLSCAPQVGIRVQESVLTAAQFAQAPAIVLSNVRLGLQAVHWYEGRRLGVPPALERLWEAIDGAAK